MNRSDECGGTYTDSADTAPDFSFRHASNRLRRSSNDLEVFPTSIIHSIHLQNQSEAHNQPFDGPLRTVKLPTLSVVPFIESSNLVWKTYLNCILS